MIAIPKWILGVSWWTILGAFLLMIFITSICSLLVLLSPHANTASAFPLPDEHNSIGHSWFWHQLVCTNDVYGKGWFTGFFMGNFNFHVIHHLFPRVNHLHYPALTKELMRLAYYYKLPYRCFTLTTSLRNHFRLLRQNGTPPVIFEETM